MWRSKIQVPIHWRLLSRSYFRVGTHQPVQSLVVVVPPRMFTHGGRVLTLCKGIGFKISCTRHALSIYAETPVLPRMNLVPVWQILPFCARAPYLRVELKLLTTLQILNYSKRDPYLGVGMCVSLWFYAESYECTTYLRVGKSCQGRISQ